MYLVMRCMYLVVFPLLLLPLIAHASPFDAKHVVELLERPSKSGVSSDPLKINEIKSSHNARTRAYGVEIDNINFLIGDPVVAHEEAKKLHELALALKKIITKRPNEMFLIEGHTDAVGKQKYNMPLSHYRAAAFKSTLVAQYHIPERNIVVAGYGSDFLKVNVATPERANRRITVRRVTDLMRPRRQLHLGGHIIRPAAGTYVPKPRMSVNSKPLTPSPVYPRRFPHLVIPSLRLLF